MKDTASDIAKASVKECLLPPADRRWLTSDDGGGVGGMPRVYFASYRHTRPLDMHFAHGWSPLHFAFLDLQKSHARLTFRVFRKPGSAGSLGISSTLSELLFWPASSGAISQDVVDTDWTRLVSEMDRSVLAVTTTKRETQATRRKRSRRMQY